MSEWQSPEYSHMSAFMGILIGIGFSTGTYFAVGGIGGSEAKIFILIAFVIGCWIGSKFCGPIIGLFTIILGMGIVGAIGLILYKLVFS